MDWMGKSPRFSTAIHTLLKLISRRSYYVTQKLLSAFDQIFQWPRVNLQFLKPQKRNRNFVGLGLKYHLLSRRNHSRSNDFEKNSKKLYLDKRSKKPSTISKNTEKIIFRSFFVEKSSE